MQKLAQWTYLIFFFLLPLLFTVTTSELFEFPKFLLLLASSGIVLICYLMDGYASKDWSLPYWRHPVSLSVLAILATQAISTLLSIHPYTSFWGYYSRFHQGLATTLSYTILYFGALKYLDLRTVKKILRNLLLVSVILSVLATAEHFNFSLTCPFINGEFTTGCWKETTNPLYRSFATLGQPNWLAAYLIPSIFLLIYFFLSRSKKSSTSYVFYALSYLLLFLALLYTKSRSGYLAYGASLVTYFLYSARHRLLPQVKQFLPVFLLGTALTLAIYFYPSVLGKTSSSPPAGGETVITEVSTSSSAIRKIVWTGALALFQKRPLFGSGPETFAYTYYQERPVEHNYTTEWDFLYNKAHNEYLNYLTTVGAVGLAAYLAFHFFVLTTAWRKVPPSKKVNRELEEFQTAFAPVLAASLVSFFVTNFFGFSTVPVYAVMTFFAALPLIRLTSKATELPGKLKPIAAFLIPAFLLLVPIRLFMADYYYTLGKNNASEDSVNMASALRPREPLYHSLLAELYAEEGKVTEALLELEASRSNSVHQNFFKSRAKTYITLAGSDPAYYTAATRELEYAVTRAPTDPKLLYNLGLIYSRLGDADASINSMVRAIELKRDYYEPYYALTLLYESTKQDKLIPDLLEQARASLKVIPEPLTLKIDKYLGK